MASIAVKIAGELIPESILALVEVRQKLNRHSWCKVVCRQTEDERSRSKAYLARACRFYIRRRRGEVVVFDGFICHVELKYEIYGSYTATRIRGVTQFVQDGSHATQGVLP